MPPVKDTTYNAYTCGCSVARLWLEQPRHITCSQCGQRIGMVRLVDVRVLDDLHEQLHEERAERKAFHAHYVKAEADADALRGEHR